MTSMAHQSNLSSCPQGQEWVYDPRPTTQPKARTIGKEVSLYRGAPSCSGGGETATT